MRGNEMCMECGPIWRVDAHTCTDGENTWTIN